MRMTQLINNSAKTRVPFSRCQTCPLQVGWLEGVNMGIEQGRKRWFCLAYRNDAVLEELRQALDFLQNHYTHACALGMQCCFIGLCCLTYHIEFIEDTSSKQWFTTGCCKLPLSTRSCCFSWIQYYVTTAGRPRIGLRLLG